MLFKILTTIGTCGARLELMKCCRGICHLKNIKSSNVNHEKTQRVLSKTLLFHKITKESFYSREVEEIKESSTVANGSEVSCFVAKKALRGSLLYVSEGTPDFESKINKNSTLTDAEWSTVRENTLQSPDVSEINLDSHVMNACFALNNSNAAASYYKYLQNNGHNINLACTRKYLSIFSKRKDLLTSADKLEITQIYDNLCKKYPHLDEQTVGICITNMCLTDRWKDMEKLIKQIAENNKYVSHVNSAFAYAAFVNGEPDIGWKYTRLFGDMQLIPNTILEGYIKYCEKYTKNETHLVDEIEKMFQFLGENRTYPSINVLVMYIDLMKKLNWFVGDCRISNDGKCSACDMNLETASLSNKELCLLTDSVVKNLVHGSDLFQNTNPKELRNFQEFVGRTKPYDIVIDGLNLYYLHKNRLHTVIGHLIREKKKILLIMRKHMIKDKKLLKFITKNTYYFAAEDLTKDDSYLIYATLVSGRNTYFLSSDLMRSQLYQMKSLHLKTIFKKWLLMRQLQVTRNFKEGIISQPYTYVPYAQKAGSCWHIPYLEKQLQLNETVLPESIRWLCLRPKH